MYIIQSKTISNINRKTEVSNVINNKRLENNDSKNLDIEYIKIKKEYDEGDCSTQKNQSYNDKQTKERLAEALAEIESMNVGIKFPNKLNKNENNNENDYDYDYEEDEDGEEYLEDEDYDDYDDNNKYKDFDYNEKNNLRIQDGVDLLPKDQISKIIEMNEKIKEIKSNQDNDNNNQYDSLTWEQLNNIILNKESILQTVRLLNEREDKKEDEVIIPELPEPRQYYSIINKIENDETFISNQPKKIGVKSVKLSKIEKNNQTKAKISQSKEKEKEENGNEEERITKKNYDLTKIDEMEKKERKKFVKLINKERRENKKELKKTFNSEKIKVRSVVSNANKVLRNGLSVKEI